MRWLSSEKRGEVGERRKGRCGGSLRAWRALPDRVERIELRYTGCLPCDPAQDVDLRRIGQGVRERVWDDLEQHVRGRVAVVIDVRLNHDAIDAVDGLLIAFMEGELHIGFAELNLLPA
jgi:hypothetical protein